MLINRTVVQTPPSKTCLLRLRTFAFVLNWNQSRSFELLVKFFLTWRLWSFDLSHTLTLIENPLSCAFTWASLVIVSVSVGNISHFIEISLEVSFTDSFFGGWSKKRFYDFDAGFLFFSSDLCHDDIGLNGAKIESWPIVSVYHKSLLLKIINLIYINSYI